MIKKFKFLLIVFLMSSFQFQTIAQNANDTTTKVLYKLVKLDGTQYIGYILEDDGREVLINTKKLGKIYIPKSDVKTMKPVQTEDKLFDGNYREVGPFTTRYHITTNALPIQKGEDYAMIQLYGPEVHFGVAKNLSVGLMTTWIGAPMVLALKYTIPTNNEKINFGLGTLLGSSSFLNGYKSWGGLHWGMVTFGDRKRNLTLSAGFTHLDLKAREYNALEVGTYNSVDNGNGLEFPSLSWSFKKQPNVTAPIFGVGGLMNVGKKASFVFDAMLIFSNQASRNTDVNYFYTDGSSSTYYQPLDPNDPRYKTPDHIEITAKKDIKTTIFYLMPGMRFQSTENQAFQIAIAGLTIFEGSSKPDSFPLPLVSWFFTF